MDPFAETSARSIASADRRSHPRRRVEGLVYADFGADNGGIVLNLSEGGLAYQSVEPVEMGESLRLKIKLPGATDQIEAMAKVAWLSDSARNGGVRFLALPDNARQQIRSWLAEDPLSFGFSQGERLARMPQASEPAQAPKSPESASVSEATGNEAAPRMGSPVAVGEEESQLPKQTSLPRNGAPAGNGTQIANGARVEKEEPKPQQDATGDRNGAALDSEIATKASVSASAPAVTAPSSDGKVRGAETKRPRPAATPRETREPAPKVEFSPAGAQRETETVNGRAAYKPAKTSKTNQSPKPLSPARENLWERQEQGVDSETSNRSQLVKLAIGALLGSSVVMVVMAGVPSLRDRIQSSQDRSAQAIQHPAANPGFQVEVVDLGGRHWTLDNDTPAPPEVQAQHRESQSPAAIRNDAAKAPAVAQSAAQARVNRPTELALPKPLASKSANASGDVREPSIFDGITPPIASFSAGTITPAAPAAPSAPASVPATPAASAPAPHAASLEAAVLTYRVSPVYPAAARLQRISGDVRVSATIGKDGVPRDLRPIGGDPRLIDAALAAIQQWRYAPAKLDGDATDSQIAITISFQLNKQ